MTRLLLAGAAGAIGATLLLAWGAHKRRPPSVAVSQLSAECADELEALFNLPDADR